MATLCKRMDMARSKRSRTCLSSRPMSPLMSRIKRLKDNVIYVKPKSGVSLT
jgi:hypothetical protein